MANEIKEIKKLIEDNYPEKKGYAEAVKYYYKIIAANRAVNNSDYKPVVIKFRETLKEFSDFESTTALLELSNTFQEFFVEGELADVFVTEGLKVAFDGISECLMRLKKLYFL